MVSVEVPTILRTYTDGQRVVEATGTTLAQIVASLEASYPGIGVRLLSDGELRRFVNVYVNDEDVRFMSGLATVLSDGDTVTILPAVAGGR